MPSTYSSRTWSRSDAVVPYPLCVGLLHRGLLHVLALGEDIFHILDLVGTHGWQTHVTPRCICQEETRRRVKMRQGSEFRVLHRAGCECCSLLAMFNAPDPNQSQTLKSLTTERWRLRRWPCLCGLSPSGWKRHEPRWKQSWAQAWSTPAWLSERMSTFSAECAALQGRPVVAVLEIFSSEGWEGSWSKERISTFPNMLETLTLSS